MHRYQTALPLLPPGIFQNSPELEGREPHPPQQDLHSPPFSLLISPSCQETG